MIRPSTVLLYITFTALCGLVHSPAYADNAEKGVKIPCPASDLPCLARDIETAASNITEARWRDQALRDLAVSLDLMGDTAKAEGVIKTISNPDTQAMTVREIAMNAARRTDLSDTDKTARFAWLDGLARAAIAHEGAKDIALTYIAMAQAFAGMDDAATRTTQTMTNTALRDKAYAETAEIQAQRGDFTAAMASIDGIEAISFRNKAIETIALIMIEQGKTDAAVAAADMIDNPARAVAVLQAVLDSALPHPEHRQAGPDGE